MSRDIDTDIDTYLKQKMMISKVATKWYYVMQRVQHGMWIHWTFLNVNFKGNDIEMDFQGDAFKLWHNWDELNTFQYTKRFGIAHSIINNITCEPVVNINNFVIWLIKDITFDY